MAKDDKKGGGKKGQRASGAPAEKKSGGEAVAEKKAGGEAAVEKKATPTETAVEKADGRKAAAAQASAAKTASTPDEYPHAPGDAHKVNRHEYFVIFGVLAALTVIEVAVAKVPGISRTLVGTALIGLAVTKAAIVGLFYMHLKHETRILKLTVAIPMAAPAFYALVLITEAAWRLTRW